ncbi:PSD1 and planctomycete cytochrome C domain-containing protein [Schlesneria sp. DSM 10557]|uniref:PSD1 and planctomycete cytochrome C domain-containing protein n=1 Tax=Schlesneria sp. DSM 10557 TaxID=3044399 RepID=UPI0035A01A6B
MNQKSLAILFVTVTLFSLRGQSPADEPATPVAADSVTNSPIDFVRDVQPLLEKSCIRCHGPDKQKGGLRLDVRESAFTQGDAFAPNVIAGKSDESPLISFVTGTGDLTMPPDGERLSATEIATLKSWIDQGANWPDSAAGRLANKSDLWSLKALISPPVPLPDEVAKSGSNAIDAFIQQKRTELKLRSNPEADRRTLICRVYLTLTGLPPEPAEVDQFVADPDPKAYETLVDRLLDSPRYGERWARHWLDAVHFAETHGNDQDRIREHAWPYRDYLIQAFNDDKPYSQFVQEQIAGDALFPDDPRKTAALGFLAAGPWDESSLRDIREDTLDRQIARYLDRDDMLANVINNFCSLTVQCARCHDHKFDPITQHDYYALQAVFSGVERANRQYDLDPAVHQQRKSLTRTKRELEQRSAEQLARLKTPEVQQEVAAWEAGLQSREARWVVVEGESFTSSDGASLSRQGDGSILSSGPRPDKDTVTVVWTPSSIAGSTESPPLLEVDSHHVDSSTNKFASLQRITAIRLEVLTDDSLPHTGPGRQDNGNLHLSEFELFVDDQPVPLINPSADFNQQDWDISKAIDQNEATAWGIHPRQGSPHHAVFELRTPIEVHKPDNSGPIKLESPPSDQPLVTPTSLRFVLKQRHGMGHLIGRFRLLVTDASPPVRASEFPIEITTILSISNDQRSDAQRTELALYQQLELVNRSLAALPSPHFIYAAAADFEPDGALRPPPGPRPVHVLHRGDIRHPRAEALPGGLSCLTGLPSRFELAENAPESARRAALANWIVSRENVLTWRSIVNRVWHHHFGRGLVPTLNDFGHMGEQPSHPELLDWLAIQFRDRGQSLKQLHRMILTSQTYRQSSAVTLPTAQDADVDREDIAATIDADNRFLWRMNRTRLDAESLRDSILAISGRLDLRMGGPVRSPFRPSTGNPRHPSRRLREF